MKDHGTRALHNIGLSTTKHLHLCLLCILPSLIHFSRNLFPPRALRRGGIDIFPRVYSPGHICSPAYQICPPKRISCIPQSFPSSTSSPPVQPAATGLPASTATPPSTPPTTTPSPQTTTRHVHPTPAPQPACAAPLGIPASPTASAGIPRMCYIGGRAVAIDRGRVRGV